MMLAFLSKKDRQTQSDVSATKPEQFHVLLFNCVNNE